MKIIDKDQKLVAEILTRFMFCNDYSEVMDEWNRIFKDYDLWIDPFTKCPVSTKDHFKAQKEYNRQKMIERFGYYEE